MPDIQHADLTGAELHYPRGWFQSGAGITLTPTTNSAFVVTSSKSSNDFVRYSSLLTLETMTYGAPAQRPVWRGYLNNFILDLEESETDALFLTVDGNADPLLWIDTEDAADPQTVNLDGFLALHQQAAEPVTPVANGVSVYARDVAGTAHLFAQSDDGTEHQLTPAPSVAEDEPNPNGFAWASRHIELWLPIVGSTSLDLVGCSTPGGSGTHSGPTPSSGSRLSRSVRSQSQTAASPNSWAGRFTQTPNFALETGFWMKFRVAFSAINASSWVWVGMHNATTALAGSADVNDFVNCIGFAKRTGDTNLQVASNDASGNITVHADLGSDFDATNTSAIFDLVLYVAAGGSSVDYWANRVDSVVTPVVGTISSDLPASGTFLGPRGYINTGGSSSTACQIQLLLMACRDAEAV